MSDLERIKRVIPIVNEISPTFCLAKWQHVTLYLQTGQTHSCYHPRPHVIPYLELAQAPSSLHNTRHKIDERKQMMSGLKPEGCQYCWNIESLGDDYISDRHERNASIYTETRIEEIKADPYKHYNPEYVEISFGNECNFKCGYCHPKHSSAYYKEIKDFGPYTTVKNHRNDIDWFQVYEEESNPYVDAWWQWWPELSKTLNILRITGGEPLLQQSTWKLLDSLDQDPKPNLELNINSNLGVKTVLVERLTTKVNKLLAEGKIKKFMLFTSIDTWGAPAEYLRTGLDLELWEKNLDTYLSSPDLRITFMITFNILSVATFQQLLEKILELRKKYNKLNSRLQTKRQRIRFDVPYLKEPLQYDMNLLPKEEFMPYMNASLAYVKKHVGKWGRKNFTDLEYEKFRRVVEYMDTTVYSDSKLLEGCKDFYNWFVEYDRRRGTDFLKTFPEYAKFLAECKQCTI